MENPCHVKFLFYQDFRCMSIIFFLEISKSKKGIVCIVYIIYLKIIVLFQFYMNFYLDFNEGIWYKTQRMGQNKLGKMLHQIATLICGKLLTIAVEIRMLKNGD